jgi:two-component system sensor histidine kinase RstB
MFVRIYSGILLSTLISISCCYFAFQYINHVRSIDFTLSIFSGTQQLITEGVNRHQGKKQKQWIELVEKLIGLPIAIVPINKSPLSARNLKEIETASIFIEPLGDGIHSRIWTKSSNSALISVKLKNIAEQQLRITAFLILNELGRYPRSKQYEQLIRLRQYFHYDINIYSKKQLNLDNQQLLRLDRGDVVVSFDKDKNNQDILQVYSRYKSTQQYLAIGPIATYNATPTWLMAALLILALCVTGFIIYLLVKSLELRMKSISDVVVNFGPSTLSSRVEVTGQDAIGHMATGINTMATRIESLLQDQKDITQAISHELRTPISRMKFRVEMLKDNADTDSLSKLEKLNHDIHELDLLVEELLIFQMLDTTEALEPQDIDMAALIHNMIAEIYEPYQLIELELDFPTDSVWVKGDANQLRRMLQNLIINAFKHAKSKVKVSLTASPTTLQINDDGEGIPEDERQRIFTPFVRLDSSRNRKTGGFGLGLAIIQRIARLHNASISVADSELGGANFKVSFLGSKNIPVKRRSP